MASARLLRSHGTGPRKETGWMRMIIPPAPDPQLFESGNICKEPLLALFQRGSAVTLHRPHDLPLMSG